MTAASIRTYRTAQPTPAPPFDGWLAPPLNAANPAPAPWTQQDLYDHLRTGESELHTVAAGVMASIVHSGAARLPDADVQALATYFADINGAAARAPGAAAALALADTRRQVDAGQETDPGAKLYLAARASCHYSPAAKSPAVQGSLALTTSITAEEPSNFILTVMHCIGGAGTPGAYMPRFAAALMDADIALPTAYLRRTRSDQPVWDRLPAAIAARRPHAASSPRVRQAAQSCS